MPAAGDARRYRRTLGDHPLGASDGVPVVEHLDTASHGDLERKYPAFSGFEHRGFPRPECASHFCDSGAAGGLEHEPRERTEIREKLGDRSYALVSDGIPQRHGEHGETPGGMKFSAKLRVLCVSVVRMNGTASVLSASRHPFAPFVWFRAVRVPNDAHDLEHEPRERTEIREKLGDRSYALVSDGTPQRHGEHGETPGGLKFSAKLRVLCVSVVRMNGTASVLSASRRPFASFVWFRSVRVPNDAHSTPGE